MKTEEAQIIGDVPSEQKDVDISSLEYLQSRIDSEKDKMTKFHYPLPSGTTRFFRDKVGIGNDINNALKPFSYQYPWKVSFGGQSITVDVTDMEVPAEGVVFMLSLCAVIHGLNANYMIFTRWWCSFIYE